jgi:hypothetical protein
VNSLLLTLTAVLILVLSALFAAPLFIDWNDYRSVFETQATNLLGRQVKVGGKVHLVLLPSPELRFDAIKVADQEGRLDRPFLEARSLEAWLNIGALLSGTIEARKIAMVDPILRLDLKADGTGNWSDVGRRGVGLPFAPKDVMLDEVGVSGGTIEITKQGVPQFTLTGIVGRRSCASRPASLTRPECFASNRRCATSTAIPPLASTAAWPGLAPSLSSTAPSWCAPLPCRPPTASTRARQPNLTGSRPDPPRVTRLRATN